VFLVKGAVDVTNPKQLKIKANQCVPIELALQEWQQIQHALFELPLEIDEPLLTTFQQKLSTGSIPASCIFHDQGKKLRLSMRQKVALDEQTINALAQLNIHVSLAL
jgi:hypothetical protein